MSKQEIDREVAALLAFCEQRALQAQGATMQPDTAKMMELIENEDLEGIRKAVQADPSLLKKRYGVMAHNPFETILTFAIASSVLQLYSQSMKAVELLYELAPELLHVQNGLGAAPLKRACGLGDVKIAQFLLDRGAKIDAQDPNGWSALMEACDECECFTVDLLLSRGAKVELRDTYGRTALMLACEKGYQGIAESLLEHGADPNVRDAEGMGVYLSACEGGHEELADFLRKHGTRVSALELKVGAQVLKIRSAN